MFEATKLFESTLELSATSSYDGSRASKCVQSGMAALRARSGDLFWQSAQCMTLIFLRFFQLSLIQRKVSEVSALTYALYLDKFVSKLQLRRAVQRLCLDFASIEGAQPEPAALLADLICDLSQQNLLVAKILTILPDPIVRNSLCPASPRFRKTFSHELSLLGDGREPYLAQVDALLDAYVAAYSDLTVSEGSLYAAASGTTVEQLRSSLRCFFTQDVLLHKWACLNWVFVRRCVQRALTCPAQLSEWLLREVFDEATRSGTGMAAMDFGYAFDSLIWEAEKLDDAERLAAIIAEAVKSDIVPVKYLTDAEILVASANPQQNDSAWLNSEAFRVQRRLLERVEALVGRNQEAPFASLLAAADGQAQFPTEEAPLRRRYSRLQSL